MSRRPWLADETRTAVRAIMRRPATSLLLIVTIGLGIGASTAIFTVVDAVMLRPLPFADPARLANVWRMETNGFAHPGVERDIADFWIGQRGIFARVESFIDRSMLFQGADEPTDARATFVSGGLFGLLGVPAALGRTILPEDVATDAPNVAVVSHDLWRRELAGRADVIGRPITLDGRPYLVVGVMPAWFNYPLGRVSAWLPLKPGALPETDQRTVNLVARIRDDVTPQAAQARIKQLAAQVNASSPRQYGWDVGLFFLDRNAVNPDVRRALWVLAGAVLSLLLIACANAANILLVRATARHRELTIRAALGATRATLVRQLVVESLLIALAGGAAGVAMAFWGVDLLLLIVPPEMSFLYNATIAVDARVLVFATVVSIATGLLFGVGPAIRASRARGTFAMQDRSASASRATSIVRGTLIVGEVALSLALLAGAALFARSFLALNGVNPGFDADRVVSAEVSISRRYSTPAERAAVVARYAERLRALPGVAAVSVSTGAPPRAGVTFGDRVEAEGAASPLNTEVMTIPFTEGDETYFATLGIRVARGRGFTTEDRRVKDRRAVIDPDLARALWPDADPVGRRFRLGPDDPWITVLGVADDVKLMGPDDAAGTFGIYYPMPEQGRATRFVDLIVRASGDPRRLVEPIKRAIWAVDPQQPINHVATARDEMRAALAKPRFLLTLMGVFAAVALGLAVVGLYGVLSHAVAQRTREIGIRMALGAQAGAVLRAVLGHGLVLTASGIAIGVALTAAGGRVVRTLLFGVTPLDPLALALAALGLGVAALVACYIPARRATRVDPLVALRME